MRMEAINYRTISNKLKVFGIVVIFLFLAFMPMASSVNMPPPNQKPYGNITSINPNPAIVGTPVSFSGRAKDPENGTIFITWYFGDGGQATSQGTGWWYYFSASHTYTSTGVFTVTLHIEDMGGA